MTKTLTVTDFIRNLGVNLDLLPRITKMVLTRDGRPYAEIRLTPEERNRKFLQVLGTFDGRLFANDKVWKEVAVRRNRKKPIII